MEKHFPTSEEVIYNTHKMINESRRKNAEAKKTYLNSIKKNEMSLEELLKEMIKYIEESEVFMDRGEYGQCKNLNELIEDGEMPDLYFAVKAAYEMFVRINTKTDEEKFIDELNQKLTEIEIPWLKYLDKE